MTAALEGGEWSAARPGRTLPPGKVRYPFYRKLGGHQGRSGRAENLVHNGIRSRTVQPVISIEVVGKDQPESGLECMGDASVLSHCPLLRDPGPKQICVLEHCSEGETNGIFLTASLRRRRMSGYLSLFIVEITVNYTSVLKLTELLTYLLTYSMVQSHS